MKCKYEITPCLKRGLWIGQAARIVRPDTRPDTKYGTKVFLTEDDGTNMPKFRSDNGTLLFLDLDCLMHSVHVRQ